jgi:hypothetical protein
MNPKGSMWRRRGAEPCQWQECLGKIHQSPTGTPFRCVMAFAFTHEVKIARSSARDAKNDLFLPIDYDLSQYITTEILSFIYI